MHKKSIIVILIIVSAIALVSIENQNAIAQTYTLRVDTYNGNTFLATTGVDILVENTDTGYYILREYLSLPPPSIFTYWQAEQFPPYSYFRVCAYYHTTQGLISCEYYQSGNVTPEVASINLSP
jgi:hypothetical protein